MNQPAQEKLALAIRKNDLDLLRQALDDGADLNAPLFNGAPPLVVLAESVISGYPESRALFNELVERGADVNQVDPVGYTALHWSAGADDLEMVRLLLSKGADPLQKDYLGRSPLDQTSPTVSRTLLENASGTLYVPSGRASMKM